jgi:hypothetical protein
VKIRTKIVASTCFVWVSAFAQQTLAQNWDGTGPDPNVPKAPVAPAAPGAKPVIIPIGPDGKVIGEAPAAPSGIYYSDAGPVDDQRSLNLGTTPALHVVRKGDTLWDVCYYYFNDPWQWPKIWSFNAQISNPHWIYPGDLVRLLPRGTAAEPAAIQSVNVETPEDPRRLPARTFEVQLRQTAFIEQDSIETSIRLEGAVDEKSLLSAGDSVFLTYNERNPPKVGERYSVYVPG